MVLIIDDEVTMGTALEKLLRFAGLEAVAISNGMEALSMLHVRKPHLIILDLHMPMMDGMTVLRAIRQDETFENVPVMIYTSEFSQGKEREALEAGAQLFIVKGTMGWDSLVARVHDLLKDRKPQMRLAQ